MRVAVVGGGPAGASAALALARAGVPIDLFVPGRPGEKPCGGAVPEHVLPRLAGFDPSGLPAVVSPEAVLENAAGSSLEIDLRGIRIFRRADLDRALVEAAVAAGAVLLPRRADDASLDSYDWIVGADGARGRTRRRAGAPSGLEPQGESLGLGGSLRGLAWDRLVLAFPDLADAYLWIFPRPGGASVGIAYTAGRLSDGAARSCLDGFLDRHLPAGWRDLPGPRYRYPIPVFGPWTLEAVRRGVETRVLLTGDAAALADPLTREGIRYGMLSGLWAAECLIEGAPETYPERLAAGLKSEMERAADARSIFFDDPIGQGMVPVARRHPGIRRVLSDLLACRQPYTGLRRRLLRAAVGL